MHHHLVSGQENKGPHGIGQCLQYRDDVCVRGEQDELPFAETLKSAIFISVCCGGLTHGHEIDCRHPF